MAYLSWLARWALEWDYRYIQAFNAGYLLAIERGMESLSKKLVDQGMEAAIKRMQGVAHEHQNGIPDSPVHPAIQVDRVPILTETSISTEPKITQEYLKQRPTDELQAKREEFFKKYSLTKDAKYLHYLEVLDWALAGNPHE